MRIFSSVLLMALAAASAAQATDRACQRDLVSVRSTLIKNAVRLERVRTSAPKEQCVAFRQYAEVVDKARKLFERCNTAQELDRDVSGMDHALSDVKAAIANRCAEN